MTLRIAVTGAGGYLGSRLVHDLGMDTGIHVTALSREPRTAEVLRTFPGVESRVIDWQARGTIRSAIEGADAVIHLAGPDEDACQADPAGALCDVTTVTSSLLDAVSANAVRRIIYVSTAKIYGAALTVGRTTEDSPIRPQRPYATSRLIAEYLIRIGHDTGNWIGIILRLSNGVGAPALLSTGWEKTIAGNFIRQAQDSQSITITGDPRSRRDFISMTGVVTAIRHMLSLDKKVVGNGVFNVGSGTSLSLRNLADLIVEARRHLYKVDTEVHAALTPLGPDPSADMAYCVDRLQSTGLAPSPSIAAAVEEMLISLSNPRTHS